MLGPLFGRYLSSKVLEPLFLVATLAGASFNFGNVLAIPLLAIEPIFLHLSASFLVQDPYYGPIFGSTWVFTLLFLIMAMNAPISNKIGAIVIWKLLEYMQWEILLIQPCQKLSLAAVLLPAWINPQSLILSLPLYFTFNWLYAILEIHQCGYGSSQKYSILDRSLSSSGYVATVDIPSDYGQIRILRCDHSILGGIFLDHGNASIFGTFYYMDFVRYIKGTSGDSVLQIGLGVGISAKTLLDDGFDVDVVEYDKAVYKFAREYFNLPEPNEIYLTDGRLILDTSEKKYDYILHDVFTGGLVPGNLFTVESLKRCAELLTLKGAMAINFVGHPDSLSTKTVIATIQSVFKNVLLFKEHDNTNLQNLVFFVTNHESAIEFNFQYRNSQSAMYELVLEQFKNTTGITPPKELGISALHDNNNTLDATQYASALQHFYAVNELFDNEFWLSAY